MCPSLYLFNDWLHYPSVRLVIWFDFIQVEHQMFRYMLFLWYNSWTTCCSSFCSYCWFDWCTESCSYIRTKFVDLVPFQTVNRVLLLLLNRRVHRVLFLSQNLVSWLSSIPSLLPSPSPISEPSSVPRGDSDGASTSVHITEPSSSPYSIVRTEASPSPCAVLSDHPYGAR